LEFTTQSKPHFFTFNLLAMAMYSNPEKVKKAFIENDKAFYAVYSSKDTAPMKTNSTEDDVQTAADGLHRWLRDIEYTGELRIYQFDKFPAKLSKDKLVDSLFITYAFKQQYTPEEKADYYARRASAQPAGTDPALIAILDRMEQRAAQEAERLAIIEALVQEMAEAEDDEEIEENAENNVLGAVLGNPAVQNILMAFATNLGANLATNQISKRPVAMAGIVDENPEINELVEKLFSKGVTVEHLRKLSEMPAVKIKSLLLML
jgi:hypothetical protein